MCSLNKSRVYPRMRASVLRKNQNEKAFSILSGSPHSEENGSPGETTTVPRPTQWVSIRSSGLAVRASTRRECSRSFFVSPIIPPGMSSAAWPPQLKYPATHTLLSRTSLMCHRREWVAKCLGQMTDANRVEAQAELRQVISDAFSAQTLWTTDWQAVQLQRCRTVGPPLPQR